MAQLKPGKTVSDQQLLYGLLAVTAISLIVLCYAITQKGVWYDEQWSKWMSSRELGLVDAARDRWFHDVHPPFFYLFNWSLSAIVGPDVVAHRWLNFIWLAALGGVGSYVAVVRPQRRPALVVGALLLLSNTDFNKFSEYRSYAIVICATAAMVLLLQEMLARNRDLELPSDTVLAAMLVITIGLALNLHYISTLVCGVTIGVFALEQLRQRRRRWAALMIGVSVLAMIPVFWALWAESAYMKDAVPDFWIKTSAVEAFVIMAGKVVLAGGFNVVVMGCAAFALWQRFRPATAVSLTDADRADWHFAGLAAIAFGLACFLLFAVNLVRPIIVPRYLNALTPVAISIIATLAAGMIVSRRWLHGLFLANAVVVAVWLAWSIQKKPAWDEGARLVVAQLRACPDTMVYSMWRMHGLPAPGRGSLPNEAAFIAWAMADIARGYAIPMRFVEPPAAGGHLPRADGGCPTLLWMEHAAALDGVRTAQVAGLLASPADATVLKTVHTGTGTIIALASDQRRDVFAGR